MKTWPAHILLSWLVFLAGSWSFGQTPHHWVEELAGRIDGLAPARLNGSDSFILFERVRGSNDSRSFTLKGRSYNSLLEGDMWLGNAKVQALFYSAFGLPFADNGLSDNPEFQNFTRDLKPMRNLDEARELFSRHRKLLNYRERLALLSFAGSNLARVWTDTGIGEFDLNRVWVAYNQGTKAGNCRAIHATIDLLAQSLGFESRGTGSVISRGDRFDGEGHNVAFYVDSETGRILMQNYGSIVDLGTTNYQDAIELANQLNSPFANTVSVEAVPGRVNHFQTRIGEWAGYKINPYTNFEPFKTGLQISSTQHETTARFTLAKSGSSAIKGDEGFAVVSKYSAPEGDYTMAAIGYGTRTGFDKAYQDKAIKRLSLSAQMFMGYMWVQSPDLMNPDSTENFDRHNLFLKTDTKLTADFGAFKAKSTFRMDMSDLGGVNNATMPLIQLDAGGAYVNGPLTVDLFRRLQAVKNDMLEQKPAVQTAFDRLDLIYQADLDKFYVSYKGSFFLLDGVEHLGATAVQTRLRAAIRAGVLGDVYIIGDSGKVLRNHSRNPLYDGPGYAKLAAGLRKSIKDRVTMDLSGARVVGQQPYYMREPGETPPTVTRGSTWRGSLQVAVRLGKSRKKQAPPR